jgi:hypothetical protein
MSVVPATPDQPASATTPVVAEVVARHRGRVVDVQHVGQFAEPRVGAAACFTVGGCMVAFGLLLAAGSLPDAPAPGPAIAAPAAPARGGGGAGLGALLVLLGVVPLVVGAGRLRPVPRDRYILGEAPDAHLAVALPPEARAGVPLVVALERHAVLTLAPGMTGEIVRRDERLDVAGQLAQGRRSLALDPGDRCRAALGELELEVAVVEPARFVGERRPVDRLYWLSNAAALAAVGGALWLGEPRPVGELEVEEVSALRARAAGYLAEVPPPPPPPERPPPPSPRVEKVRPRPTPAPPTPPPAAAAEVASDTPKPGGGAPKDALAAVGPRGSRRGIRDDFDHARSAGALGNEEFIESIRAFSASTQEGLLHYRDTPGTLAMWTATANAPVSMARHFGGLELAETERGGGVHGPRAEKPKARLVDARADWGDAGPTAEERALARRVVDIRFETPYVQGDMDAETVQSYMRQHEGGLRACYKTAVGALEEASGTVLFRLKVDADGNVVGATLDFGSSKFGDIGPCIEKAARAWKFVAPNDRKPAKLAVEVLFKIKSY